MKFLPEEKKKRLRSAIILIISIAGIVYFNFFSGPSAGSRRPANQAFPPADIVLPDASSQPLAPGSVAKPAIKKSQGGPLPYGKEIDTKILEEERFRVLKGATLLKVTADELGRDNLFGP